MERIDIQQPYVLGISFGAGVAMEFYHRYPDVPRTLVLALTYVGLNKDGYRYFYRNYR